MEEQVTSVHLVSEYVILGTMQGSLHIQDLYRSEILELTVVCSLL